MNSNNSSKQILLSVIGVAILVVAVVGVSFAFFSYVYNGTDANTVKTGTIVFSASDTEMTLTNVFPTDAANATSATVSVTGNTTYANGIDFEIKAVDVANKSTTIVPTITVEESTLDGVTKVSGFTGTELSSGTSLYKGKIAADTSVDGTVVTIKAYYDKAKYHISDSSKEALVAAGLLEDSYAGTIVTTNDWNALSADDATAFSFKIQVIATEGAGA